MSFTLAVHYAIEAFHQTQSFNFRHVCNVEVKNILRQTGEGGREGVGLQCVNVSAIRRAVPVRLRRD